MHIFIVKRCFHCKRKDKESKSRIVVACSFVCWVVCVLSMALSKASHCRQEACPFNWVNTHTVPITFTNNYVTWCCSKNWWNQLFSITHHTQTSNNINFYVYYVTTVYRFTEGAKDVDLDLSSLCMIKKK